ncbi:hypothetical protein FRB97_000381 [Tulasnella sp. 331]|nr:hypothetical protein FRB97_000381 [Tulasnella sp. 331]KAG8887109.1 hypothetical protein FRB98_000579 [Tulasnella sp. 332]
MSVPTGPRKSSYSRRSSSPPLPRSSRQESSPAVGYTRKRSRSKGGRRDRDRAHRESHPTSPTSPFQSPSTTAFLESPSLDGTQSSPDHHQKDELKPEPSLDVKAIDSRARMFSTKTTSQQIAVVAAHIQAERCAAMMMNIEKGDTQEGIAAATTNDSRSRPSSPTPASPIVTVELPTPTSVKQTDMEVEVPEKPVQATESLTVPQRHGDDGSEDVDMDISPAGPTLSLLPDASLGSSVKPFAALDAQSAAETRPPQPMDLSTSGPPTHHRSSSLPVQGSPPRHQQVREAAVVSLSSPQVSVSPTISVVSCPSSGVFAQRKLTSKEGAPPVSLTQNINALVKSISNVVRYRLDYDTITTQILTYERRLQAAAHPPTSTPSIASSSSDKPVDPRLGAIRKAQSSQSASEDEQTLLERKSLEAKIAKGQRDQALVQAKLSQEMARVQQHAKTFYSTARSDFIEGAGRARSQSTEAKDRVEEREETLVISSPENIGLGLQIAGGSASVNHSVMRAEHEAPASALALEFDGGRLDRLEADLTAQFSELTDQCHSAFTTLTDDRKEVISEFERRFEDLNKLFVSGIEFKQFRDSLEQLRKGLNALVDVDKSRSEEAKMLSGVVKDAKVRMTSLEGQLKAQKVALDGFVASSTTLPPAVERASRSGESSLFLTDPQLLSHVEGLKKRIDDLTTDNDLLRSQIDQCATVARSKSQTHDNESRTQLSETVQGYRTEMARINNSMSVLAAIATGKPGFDYLRMHLGNIVVGDDIALSGTSDVTGHTGPNYVLPIPLPPPLPSIGASVSAGLEMRNSMKKPSLSVSTDGPVAMDGGRTSEEDHASVTCFKVED